MNKLKNQNGFAILYTVLIITMLTSLSVSVANLVFKERSLARNARFSLDSKLVADLGVECILFNDKGPTSFFDPATFIPVGVIKTIRCGKINDIIRQRIYNVELQSSSPSGYTIEISPRVTTGNSPCFIAYLTRDLIAVPAGTKIEVYGYNYCDPNTPERVERGIIASF